MGTQTRGDLVEIAVVVAGMADELEGSIGRHSAENLGECGGVEVAGCRDTEGSVGCQDASVAELRVSLEGRTKTVEEIDLKAALEVSMREALGEGGLEGIADGIDAIALEDAKQRSRYGRKEVGVFVGIGVGDGDACAVELVDLGLSFALDVGLANATAEERLYEVEQRGAEGFAVGAEQGGDGFGR